jgi:hypothetical protein
MDGWALDLATEARLFLTSASALHHGLARARRRHPTAGGRYGQGDWCTRAQRPGAGRCTQRALCGEGELSNRRPECRNYLAPPHVASAARARFDSPLTGATTPAACRRERTIDLSRELDIQALTKPRYGAPHTNATFESTSVGSSRPLRSD